MTRRGFFRRAAGVGAAAAAVAAVPGTGRHDGAAAVIEGGQVLDQGTGKIEFRGGRSNDRGIGGSVEVHGAVIANGVYFENMIVPADTRVIFVREGSE